jgi:Tetrapyrrole (Corrin/Porphyrin) Methylases
MQEVPTNGSPQADVDLYILGAGVSFPDHLTLQTLEILSMCEQVYTLLPKDQLDVLPPDLRTKCTSIWSLYRDKQDRSENRKNITKAVIDRATSVRPFGWMTYGHPVVFDSVTQALIKAGEERGWRVSVVPAISCFDTVLADVGYDPARGLMVYEAYSLVKHDVPIVTSLATLLLQPSVFGTPLADLSGTSRPDLTPLRDHIRQFHTSDHECAFIISSNWHGEQNRICWRKLSDLESIPVEALGNSTLFIPPVERNRLKL